MVQHYHTSTRPLHCLPSVHTQRVNLLIPSGFCLVHLEPSSRALWMAIECDWSDWWQAGSDYRAWGINVPAEGPHEILNTPLGPPGQKQWRAKVRC